MNINKLSEFNIQDEEKKYLRNMYLREAIVAQDEVNTLTKELKNKKTDQEKKNIGIAIMLAHQTIKLIQLSLFDLGSMDEHESKNKIEES